MKLKALGVLTLLTTLTLFARADDTGDTKEFLKPDNWEGLSEYWSIKDGVITGKTEKNPGFNTFFCSKQKYTDFEIKCKVKITPKETGNSGIQIRSKVLDGEKEKGKFIVAGPQADMGATNWGGMYGEKFGGMMKAVDRKIMDKAVLQEEFNDYLTVVKGKHVKIVINGTTTMDEDFEKMPDDGIIAFQIHAGKPMEVIFKDIEFKKLK